MIFNFSEFINERLTLQDFIDKSRKIHGDKYDYSKTKYVRNRDRVKIICPIHGEFEQLAAIHLRGGNCPKCGVKYKEDPNDDFLKRAREIHGDKYEYLSNYIGFKKPIKMICKEHNIIFFQTPQVHLRGSGCTKCGRLSIGSSRRLTDDIFIQRAKLKHGDRYDYSDVIYKSDNDKVNIICPKHGKFSQRPSHHLSGNGCPSCRESKGEANIAKYLDSISVKYIRNKKFDDCLSVRNRRLPFDFYLPDYNICIEYDGEQHYMSVSVYGGEEKFKNQQINDKIKSEYCDKNGIKLLRISYKISGYQKISDEVKKYLSNMTDSNP